MTTPLHFGDDTQRYRLAAEAAVDAILLLDEAGTIHYANPSSERLLGYAPAELTGCTIGSLLNALPGDDSAHRLAQWLRHGHTAAKWTRIEAGAFHRDGRTMLFEISLTTFQHPYRTLHACMLHDVTAQKRAQRIASGQHRLLEMIALGVPLDQVLEKLIRLVEALTPGMLGSVLLLGKDGAHVGHGVAPGLPPSFVREVNGLAIGPAVGSCGTAMFTGQPVIVTDILTDPLWESGRAHATQYGLRACWSMPIFSSAGQVLGSFAMYYTEPRRPEDDDLRLAELASHLAGIAIERQASEERIRHMANHDALTGLPNRALLHEELHHALGRAARRQTPVALLFIDLDNFKRINDSLGHHVGDLLLQGAARRLSGCVRTEDVLARLGGDEFVIALGSLQHGDEAAAVAAKALAALEAPFDIDGQALHVDASIGISLFPHDGNNASCLMRAADTAMYHAKALGRGNYQFFTPEMNVALQQRMGIEGRLRQAFARGALTLHYQPQVDMQSRRIFSAEALLRWEDGERGPVPPEQFIAVAEESGLILQIGEWVLRQACRQLAHWRAAGHPQLRIAVNLSARQVLHSGLPALVADILRENALPAGALELEITETMLMQPNRQNSATLRQLSEMGVAVAIDDFGIGYSNLSYLKRFPVSALKIDRSFVGGIARDQHDLAITRAIMGVAHGLRLNVVAEGVETAAQANLLLSLGCTAAQGFYYGRPQTAAAFLRLLQAEPVA